MMNVLIRILSLVFIMASLLLSLAGCQTGGQTVEYGLLDEHASYVPARIAVFPCQAWPNGARYAKQPLTSTSEAEQAELCKQFDKFVIGGFENQPFMRGVSPKALEKYLNDAKRSQVYKDIPNLWKHEDKDCVKCLNSPAFYMQSIAPRSAWRDWLGQLVQSIRNADAVLLPFALYEYQNQYDDRGLLVSRRAAGVVMLLVDTAHGYLLWSGGRDAEAIRQRLLNSDVPRDVPYPPWEDLWERLFIEELWKDFPGRQIFK